MRVFLKALGCRLNEAELQLWGQQFLDAGHQLSAMEKADLLVLNSCAVTGEAARKSRQSIRRLHRENPTARLVVTGCYASLNESEAAAILGVDLVVDKNGVGRHCSQKVCPLLRPCMAHTSDVCPGEQSRGPHGSPSGEYSQRVIPAAP